MLREKRKLGEWVGDRRKREYEKGNQQRKVKAKSKRRILRGPGGWNLRENQKREVCGKERSRRRK